MTTQEKEAAEPASKVDLPGESGGGGEIPTYNLTLKVRRYNPEVSEEAHWEDLSLIHI